MLLMCNVSCFFTKLNNKLFLDLKKIRIRCMTFHTNCWESNQPKYIFKWVENFNITQGRKWLPKTGGRGASSNAAKKLPPLHLRPCLKKCNILEEEFLSCLLFWQNSDWKSRKSCTWQKNGIGFQPKSLHKSRAGWCL